MAHLSFFLILFFWILVQVIGQYNILSLHKPLLHGEKDIVSDDDLKPSVRIAGGYLPRDSNLTKFVVSIRTRYPTGYWGDNHFCSGAIISKNMVLTAAHCIVDGVGRATRPHRLNIVAGSPYRLKKSVTCLEFKVKRVIPNLKFRRNRGNDLAIIVLNDDIPKLNRNIKIIPILTKRPPVGTPCFTLGWGQLYWDGPFTNKPFYGQLSILDSKICQKLYGAEFTSDLLCAQNPLDHFVDACRGDAGGPLICNDKLVGINSFTSMCAKAWPATYTDVTKHLKWIQAASEGSKIEVYFYGNLLVMILFFII